MTIIALIAIIAVVALLALLLGMSLSSHRPRGGEHFDEYAHSRSQRRGGGRLLLAFITVPLAMGMVLLLSWSHMEVRTTPHETAMVAPQDGSFQRTQAAAPVTRAPVQPVLIDESHAVPVNRPPQIDDVAAAPPADSAFAAHEAPASSHFDSPPVHTAVKTDWLVGGLISAAVLIAAGIWIAHRRQHWSLAGITNSMVRSLWVLPILASVGWVGYLIWPHLSVEPLVRNPAYNTAQHDFPRYLNEPQSYFVPSSSEMPAWITDGITSRNDLVYVPICSGWSIYEEETMHEARQQALRTIQEDFALTYPSSEDWRFDVNLDDFHAIAAEYVESKSITYGSSDPEETLTYRTHLLVELSEPVRGELVNRWKPELQEFRIKMLLTFGGLLTLICFASAACLNFDMRTQGAYRRWLRVATVSVVVAAAAVAHGVLGSLWFQHSV